MYLPFTESYENFLRMMRASSHIPPRNWGIQYIGSSLCRKNNVKRKHRARYGTV